MAGLIAKEGFAAARRDVGKLASELGAKGTWSNARRAAVREFLRRRARHRRYAWRLGRAGC
jgi:hypothetical protein